MEEDHTPRPPALQGPLAPQSIVQLPDPAGETLLTLQLRSLPEDRRAVEVRICRPEAPGAWVRLDRELWEPLSRLLLAEPRARLAPRRAGDALKAMFRWFGLPLPGQSRGATPQVPRMTPPVPPGPRPGFRVTRADPKPELAAGSPPDARVLLRDTESAEPLGLYVDDRAWNELRTQLDWAKQTQRNRVEQGGLMLGQVWRDPVTQSAFARVDRFVLAEGARAGAVQLNLSTDDFAMMYGRIEELKTLGELPAEHGIVGWYHTHPGGLPVFMSDVDMQTQRCLFPEDYHFALVLNPHSFVFRCFQGAAATSCGVAIVESPAVQE